MTKKQDLIIITKEIRQELAKKFSSPTIKRALDGEVKSLKALEVRELALKMGGKIYREVKVRKRERNEQHT